MMHTERIHVHQPFFELEAHDSIVEQSVEKPKPIVKFKGLYNSISTTFSKAIYN